MVKRNSLMMLALLIGVACVTDELQARDGRGGGGGGMSHGGGGMSHGGGGMSHGGGGSRSGGMSHGGGMRSSGMSRGSSARSAGVSRGSIARSSTARSGGRHVNVVTARDTGRHVNVVSGRDLAGTRTGTVTRTGAIGSTRARNAALVGGAAVGGAAVGAAAARTGRTATAATGTTAAGRAAVAGRTVPSSVVSATQNAARSNQRIAAGRGEASAINREAGRLRAPAGGNTTQRNRPQSFNAGGRRAHAFWRNGNRHIVSFRGGIPFLWASGWWTPWPLFWNYWPWWYGFSGYYGRSYDECYDCDYYDCPDYCYQY